MNVKIDNEDMFIYTAKKKSLRVKCADIVFFESSGHYIIVHTKNGTTYSIRCKITELVEAMDKKCFERIHRGIVVNLKYVAKVKANRVLLNSVWKSVPVSRLYKEHIAERITL